MGAEAQPGSECRGNDHVGAPLALWEVARSPKAKGGALVSLT